jgi:CheY-like chemotaxis protein
VPAAAVTACATREDRERALHAGYTAHLAKPVDPATLIGTVLRLAGRGELPRS